MTAAPVRRLDVLRRLANGERVCAGTLASSADGRATYFQYDADYLRVHAGLSPFALPADGELHRGPAAPHGGLHGVFADSLPDGWGLLLMDRAFRRHGVPRHRVTALDRLAYVGERGMGALEYAPVIDYGRAERAAVDVGALGDLARAIFEARAEEDIPVPAALAHAGSSAGARPKALLYLSDDGELAGASLSPGPGLTPALVKFTSASLPLGHEESLCEAAYLRMARDAGIDTPSYRLIPAPASSPAVASLALTRFDCTAGGGRYHMHTLCGLLDADFRAPSMDYEDLIRASQVLCGSPAVGQDQFARAVFNLFALNQDDHTRNWAFLQDDAGRWRPSPAFDLTFSPTPHGEHATAFAGHGSRPPLRAMQALASQANFATWNRARECIERVLDGVAKWPEYAAEAGVGARTRTLVAKELDRTYRENKALLAGTTGSGGRG